jgi:hypothetical protein
MGGAYHAPVDRSRSRALAALDALIAQLRQSLSQGDVAVGWREATRQAWIPWITEARATAASGKVPDVVLDVALDHNGIHGRFVAERTPLSWAVGQAADAIYDWRRAN